VNKDEYLAR